MLRGLSGVQDLTAAAKLRLFESAPAGGTLRAIAVASAGTPVGDYTPDFLPLSIGLASSRLSGRLTLNYHAPSGWFLHGTGAYTWRGTVTLDRPAYFTEGRLFLSDEVAMPDVFDYMVSAGYMNERLQVPVSFFQQYTRGEADIRRHDAPFVSNRMEASRVEAAVVHWLPVPRDVGLKVAVARTLSGRNVGQSTTVTAGLLFRTAF